MLGASCKKIVLQLALQDIGQLTDFEARLKPVRYRGSGRARGGREDEEPGPFGPKCLISR
jgi:hypothetical protein